MFILSTTMIPHTLPRRLQQPFMSGSQKESAMDDDAVIGWKALKEEFGWPYSRTHTWRLMAAGKFPRCFKPYDIRNAPPLWWRREIVEFFRQASAA